MTLAAICLWVVSLALSIGFVVIAITDGTSLGDAASALVGVTFSSVGVLIPTLFLVFPDGHVTWRNGRRMLMICAAGMVWAGFGTLATYIIGSAFYNVFGIEAGGVVALLGVPLLPVAIAVATLFRPVRARVQGFIDQRFYRRKFDLQRTIEDFIAKLRDEVELSAVTTQLVDVVRNTVQPAHVSLWFMSTP